MANFDLTNLAVKMICPNNVVKTDDTDLPSVLVYIPKFKNSDVLTGGNDSTHPAFIVNGVEIPGFYYGKYQAKVYNSVAYSLPGEDPTASINFDTARARCEAKGAGWHLSTNAEWAAIALWCKKNGFLPYGNNNYGKDSRESNYKAVPSYYESGKIARVATGTGPISWSHDKTMAGIWDLNGNVWEWQGGIRLVWGELQILANNDAADPDNPQNATSICWKAINAADGALVDPESKTTDSSAHVSGKTVKLDYVNNKWTYSTSITNAKDESRSCAFYQVAADSSIGDAAKVMLRALALLPDSDVTTDVYEGDYMWWNNGVAERCVSRGGGWRNGSGAGVFSLYGAYSRSSANTAVGFRAACVRFICDSDTLDDLDSDKKQPEPKKRSILAPDFIGRIKQALARQFQKLYEAAHGEDPEGFAELAEKATDEELAKAARLSATLAQVNAAVDMYELTSKQLKLAATTLITIKTEVNDHE